MYEQLFPISLSQGAFVWKNNLSHIFKGHQGGIIEDHENGSYSGPFLSTKQI